MNDSQAELLKNANIPEIYKEVAHIRIDHINKGRARADMTMSAIFPDQTDQGSEIVQPELKVIEGMGDTTPRAENHLSLAPEVTEHAHEQSSLEQSARDSLQEIYSELKPAVGE